MQKRRYFIIMPRCSLNALTFYDTKCYGFILLNSCREKNAVVSVLVGDDDSSTISKVRQNVEHEVEKWSNVVHVKRSFGSSLYSIKTQNKSLTDMVMRYFQRCFSYALKQNKDNEEGVGNGLKSMVTILPGATGVATLKILHPRNTEVLPMARILLTKA